MTFPARLIDGYRSFAATRLPLEASRRKTLAETGQKPHALVICCCDSRLSPELIFDAHPGELFVLRNIANLVPTYSATSADGVSPALEFAVQGLNVSSIVVMGHSQCGGIRAFVERRGRPPAGFIDNWMSMIAPAAQSLDQEDKGKGLSHAEHLARLEQAAVVGSLKNLMSFPWIKSRVEAQQLKLHGAYFDVGAGALAVYDPNTGAFAAISG